MMEMGVMYAGEWKHSFDANNPEELRQGCLEAWNALESWAAGNGVELTLDPQLMIRNTFTKFSERWVPAGFAMPPKGSGMVRAPHPFKDKGVSWQALWDESVRAKGALAGCATWLDSMDRGD